MTEAIQQKLATLTEYQVQRDILEAQKKRFIDAVLTEEIQEKLAEIEAEFAAPAAAVDANIARLKEDISAQVLLRGASVKGEKVQAIWSKGKASHSETPKPGFVQVAMYRKEGEPTVSFKPVK